HLPRSGTRVFAGGKFRGTRDAGRQRGDADGDGQPHAPVAGRHPGLAAGVGLDVGHPRCAAGGAAADLREADRGMDARVGVVCEDGGTVRNAARIKKPSPSIPLPLEGEEEREASGSDSAARTFTPSEGRGSRVARRDGFTWRINSHPPLALRARSLRSAFLWKGEEEREASAHGDIHRAQARSCENQAVRICAGSSERDANAAKYVT